MDKKKELKIQITEIFMAKAGKTGWDRCFHGTIKREVDSDGNPIVRGKIKVKDGFIYAMASDQWILGDMLDDIVLMILDKGLLSDSGISIKICDSDFFLN
jgi:hypothetical protein